MELRKNIVKISGTYFHRKNITNNTFEKKKKNLAVYFCKINY